jgi:mutator protein MutT
MALIRVVAAVIRRGEDLLVCQRPSEKRHGGLWEFPGGKCEAGETDVDALRRELREELGVELASAGEPTFELRDQGSRFLIVFIPVAIRGEPQCHEHVAMRWGRPDALVSLPLAPSDREFVVRLLAA